MARQAVAMSAPGTSGAVLEFFQRMESLGGIVVTEQPKLDLELYIQNYEGMSTRSLSKCPGLTLPVILNSGRTKYDRLLLIGKCSVPLAVDALKAAVVEAKKSNDVSRYKEAWDCIRFAGPEEPEAKRDDAWIEKTEAANKAETNRLETELKGYRNNLIKESIRMGNEDLGKHFESMGQLNEAAEAFSRMRQDVSTTKQIIDCGMHLVNVSLQRRDWTMTLNNIGKIAGVQSDNERSLQAFTKIVSGVAHLGLGHFEDAARNFLQADIVVPATEYNRIASPNDIAIYGGLLSLATMDRKDLQTRVLDNQSFRSFLEHEPHIRKAISAFVNGRYSNCLSILESVRTDYLLDIYLQKHIPSLYARIRTKCIVQYFVPFSCVTLESLNVAFAGPGGSVEAELVGMIRDGELQARIDARNKLLIAVRPDPRLEMQKNALEVSQRYEHEAKERLRRISIVAAGLEVAGTKKAAGFGAGGMQALDEAWYDDNRSASNNPEVEAQV
ncbi:COP9 signalosome complex subunit 1 [Paramyrothecium foliicola]|nr:COP9 signalosome complex subunit 1 [Paramyrothecium foliicola]